MKSCLMIPMMNRLHCQKWLLASGMIVCFLVMNGCGGSSSDESTVVPPPAPQQTESTTANTQEPPGTIELPEGIDPTPGEQKSVAPGEGGFEMPEEANVPASSSAAAEMEVKYGTWDEIQAVAKSAGRITVIDLWSLSCEPCLKEFPGLVKLHQTMGDSVQCIAVDLDYDGRKSRPPEHYEERVAAFLGSVKASGFPTYISQTPSDDVFAATKLPSIPAVMIYDANGEVVKVFVDAGDSIGFSYEKDVVPFVQGIAG